MSVCPTTYFKGAGKVYLAPISATTSAVEGAWNFIGDVEALTVSSSTARTDIFENCSGDRNQAASIINETTYEFAADLRDFSPENLARIVKGSATTVAGATVSNESVVGYAVDAPIPLARLSLTAATVTVERGVTALVENTDYTIDRVNGTLTIVSVGAFGGGWVAGTPVTFTVDYTHSANEVVQAATNTSQEWALMLVGKNVADSGTAFRAVLHRLSADAVAELQFINPTDVAVFPWAGRLLPRKTVPAGESAFYTIVK